MKQANIKCPHCGRKITVRQVDDRPEEPWFGPMQEAEAFMEETSRLIDDIFARMSKLFRSKRR